MKLSKKVLAAFSMAAALAMAVSFTSCGEEDADDENGMISGSNNNYKLLYDNSASEDTSRGYVPTTGNHAGALVQITLNKEGTSGSGAAMGYIWDLQSTDASASAEEVTRAVSAKPRNFCIVGFANFSGTVKAYVSRYTNVYDIQAKNFGTDGITVNGATQTAGEEEYIKSSDDKKLTAADGSYVMTVNVYEETTGEGESKTTTGGYVVDIYNGVVEKAHLASAEKLATTTIPAADLGYDTAKKVTQKQGGVYANVYAKSKASGTWKYADTYKADKVIEE
ncbi:MAG: hypothetical protein IJ158_12280 [Treponema sp.]|nr:hypothetical protein [Treponema sp.]